METLDKININQQNCLSSEDSYITLEGVDFTDIAQAIDGSRSRPLEDFKFKEVIKPTRANDKSKRFWFW